MNTLVSTLLITALATVLCSGEAEAVIDRDIVLAMAFDEGEGATAKDLSSHGNHGRLIGTRVGEQVNLVAPYSSSR